MSQKLDTSPAVIGIDIGKNSFHIVGQNQRGAIVLRQKCRTIHSGQLLRSVGSCPMELIWWKFFAGQRVTLIKFSTAQTPAIFLSISQLSLSLSSISKLRKKSDLHYQSRCSPARTR